MKTFIVLSCFVACALAVSKVKSYEGVPIVSQVSNIDPDGKFHYSFETGDGTKAEQHGDLKVVDKEAAVVMQGSFLFTGDDGKAYKVQYTADEFGFHPSGDHLPVAPPVPEPIARALAYLATIPQTNTYETKKKF